MAMQEARQARQFGYEVSPHPAYASSAAQEYVGRVNEAVTKVAERLDLAKGVLGFVMFAVLFLILGWGAMGEGLQIAVVLVGSWVVPIAVGLRIGFGTSLAKGRKVADEQERVLRDHPWQVWPCRVENLLAEEAAAASKDAGYLGRPQPHPPGGRIVSCRVHLLAPDGSTARSYLCLLPGDVWDSMTDGLGALWICGDLREQVVVAVPGAAVCWQGRPVRTPAADGAGRTDSSVVEDIARQAGIAAIQDWLG
ncbi:hypothetical protein ACFQ8C_10345 [Streptomyces sp. NPDC056503]|uniref:hypothetical protein n=1 Tax=Streptomyces sp. NPDC056503 TaxID=3345842 RepID=UPI00367DE7E0